MCSLRGTDWVFKSDRNSFALKGLMRCSDIPTLVLQGPGNNGAAGGGDSSRVLGFWGEGIRNSSSAP